MHRTKALTLLVCASALLAAAQRRPAPRRPSLPSPRAALNFSGAAALQFTAKAVSFGPRPPGSGALRQLQAYILGQLKSDRCRVIEDDFTAQTPQGPVARKNILARFPEGMVVLDPKGALLSFNTTAEALLGLKLERFRGVPILSAGGPFPLEAGNESLARLLEDTPEAGHRVQLNEIAATTTAGISLLLEITTQRRDWGAASTAQVLVFRDASEKRRIRDEIRRADQLAFLGGLAARIAHEIRTPLATIRGLLELLQADLPQSDTRRQYIDRVLQAVDRQDRLVENLLTLSHPEPETWQAVAIPDLFDDLMTMLPKDPRLHVSFDDPATLPPVWGDPFRLGEVFTNLIRNALEAAPDDGTVNIWGAIDGPDRLRVFVRNPGASIPPELRERIFHPFFTTKARGTGLGLAIARQIVEAHRGRLWLDVDSGEATTFVVDLPTTAPVLAAGKA